MSELYMAWKKKRSRKTVNILSNHGMIKFIKMASKKAKLAETERLIELLQVEKRVYQD